MMVFDEIGCFFSTLTGELGIEMCKSRVSDSRSNIQEEYGANYTELTDIVYARLKHIITK